MSSGDETETETETEEEYFKSIPFQFEVEENRKLEAIIKFKNYICKEPEFYGIKNISAYEILTILEEQVITQSIGVVLTEYQSDLFEDLFIELYGDSDNVEHYNSFASKIFEKVYV
jgi:hypothetical protein